METTEEALRILALWKQSKDDRFLKIFSLGQETRGIKCHRLIKFVLLAFDLISTVGNLAEL